MNYKRVDVKIVFVFRCMVNGVMHSQVFYDKEVMNEYIENNKIDAKDIVDCKVLERYSLEITN